MAAAWSDEAPSARSTRPKASAPPRWKQATVICARERAAPRQGAPLSQTDPYECGLPSEVKQNFRFGISFYLVAMLFILFDIETILLYPVALQLDSFGVFALVETIVFIFLLLIAYVYVWRRGALEWR